MKNTMYCKLFIFRKIKDYITCKIWNIIYLFGFCGYHVLIVSTMNLLVSDKVQNSATVVIFPKLSLLGLMKNQKFFLYNE